MAKKSKNNNEYCAFPHCRQQSDVIWLGVGLCNHHFQWKCDNALQKA